MIFLIYNNQQQNAHRLESEAVAISVGINRSLKSAPVVVALKSGYFLHQGIKAELTMESSAVPLLAKFFSDELDIVCAPEHLVAFNALNRDDFRIVGVLNRNQSLELIINKESGIKALSGLKGARIGLKKKSSAFYLLYRLLLINNMNLSDVDLVDMAPSELPQSLADAKLDAVLTWPPFTSLAKKRLNGRALSFNAHYGRDQYWVLLAKKEWCDNNLKLLEGFLTALESGFELIDNSPEKAKEITTAYFAFPEDRVKEEWDVYTFRLELPRGLILAMEQESAWKINRLKLDNGVPDFLELIDFRAFERLYPEKIDIIH